MFQLSTLEDTFRVQPSSFGRPVEEVIREEIDAKYSRRVILEVGLCLCACGIVALGDGMVHPLDGCAMYHVRFQLLVFRPLAGEILVGTIRDSNSDGLTVSVDFFDHIVIPSDGLPSGSRYDESTRIWTWTYHNDDFPFDLGHEIYLRVKSISFTKISTHKLGLQATTTISASSRERSSSVENLDSSTPRPIAMKIVADINAHGLGPLAWWSDEG